MSYNDDDSYIIVEDHNGHSSPLSNRRNISPGRDRDRSRSRSYDDRRRSNGSGSGHRSRSPRRNRDHSRDRHRRSDGGGGGGGSTGGRSSRSNTQLDRELGLKYRWEKTVYVSNIPYDTRWPDLKDLFRSKVGDIMYCEVFERDNKSLGVAAIEFKTEADAERAVQVMHQHELGGRKISVRIDHEGYKTRQAKEMALDHHSSSSSSKMSHSNGNNSNNNNNNNNNNDNQHQQQQQQAAALALALNQASSLLTGNLGGSSANNSNLLSLLGVSNPILAQSTSPAGAGLLGAFGGANPTTAQSNLLNQLAAQLKVDGPVTNRIFVASLDYKVDEKKLREVFSLAGAVQGVSLFKDRDEKSRGMAVVEYDTPFEALNAVSMFNNQQLLDRQMTVRFDTKPPRDDEVNSKSSTAKLPSGLKSIGTGITSLLGSSNMNSGSSSSANNLTLGALSALTSLTSQSQANDLSSLASFGINLNGTGPALGSLLNASNGSSNQSNGLLSLTNLNGPSLNNSRSSSNLHSSNTISKIFVKNIPFSWDERKLKEKFRQAGYIEYAEIKIKDGKSRGCGLIRFSTPDQAVKAVELFNGSRFEGRTLEVKLDQMP